MCRAAQLRGRAFPIVLIAVLVLFGAHKYFPEWFAPKASGFGTRPATWQGWTVMLLTVGGAAFALRSLSKD